MHNQIINEVLKKLSKQLKQFSRGVPMFQMSHVIYLWTMVWNLKTQSGAIFLVRSIHLQPQQHPLVYSTNFSEDG